MQRFEYCIIPPTFDKINRHAQIGWRLVTVAKMGGRDYAWMERPVDDGGGVDNETA